MVHFVGAGPGAPDLITIRGKQYLEEADVIIYAGSLVNPKLLEYSKDICTIYNSAKMNLDEVIDVMKQGDTKNRGKDNRSSSHRRSLYLRGDPGADGYSGRKRDFL